jgi:signal transduction histidine kinase
VANLRYSRADGQDGFVNLFISPFGLRTDETGEGLLLLGQDITGYKILEGLLAQAQKLEAVGQLAAGIAHEINTPTPYIGDNVGFIVSATKKIEVAFDEFQQLFPAWSTQCPAEPGLLDQLREISQRHRCDI